MSYYPRGLESLSLQRKSTFLPQEMIITTDAAPPPLCAPLPRLCPHWVRESDSISPPALIPVQDSSYEISKAARKSRHLLDPVTDLTLQDLIVPVQAESCLTLFRDLSLKELNSSIVQVMAFRSCLVADHGPTQPFCPAILWFIILSCTTTGMPASNQASPKT